jgi:hypothetical protein
MSVFGVGNEWERSILVTQKVFFGSFRAESLLVFFYTFCLEIWEHCLHSKRVLVFGEILGLGWQMGEGGHR